LLGLALTLANPAARAAEQQTHAAGYHAEMEALR
jgi:hypothetical protein